MVDHLYGKSLEVAWVGLQVGYSLGSGLVNRQVREMVLIRLLETQIWLLTVPTGTGLSKETMASASTSVWEKVASHSGARHSSSSPYVPGAF